MAEKIFTNAPALITPLGFSVHENAANVEKEISGISLIEDSTFLNEPFYASIISNSKLDEAFSKFANPNDFMKLEKMMLLSLKQTIDEASFKISEKTALIIATTKGNIDALEASNKFSEERAYLPKLGKTIKDFFNFVTEPIVLSNACVSGLLAVSVARRIIQSGNFENAFIVAGDIVSKFTLSGFKSLQALSDTPCQPYSKNRNGITIGDAAASIAVSKNPSEFEIIGDGSCNDANHISGPSRTGEGLYRSIQLALSEAKVNPYDIDLISAHGTATIFNDEMEAVAFNRCDLQNVPLHSLKGYFGHTLGAAGLLEAVVGMESLKQNTRYTSLGFDEIGISKPLNIIKKTEKFSGELFLKTASGFGGCNAAVLFKKHEK